jgi:hypothetical protein
LSGLRVNQDLKGRAWAVGVSRARQTFPSLNGISLVFHN